MYKTFYSVSILILLVSCVPIAGTQNSNEPEIKKTILFEDQVYEKSIKSVRIYPESERGGLTLNDDILPISGSERFLLSFDEINADFKEYFVKYIPCNSDWSKSKFNDLQVIDDFNEFRVTDYEYSINSIIPYTHYTVVLPKVKHAGNYIIMVYRNANTADVILTKRISYYGNKVKVTPTRASANGAVRFTNHQVGFKISHSNFEMVNPLRDLTVVIRQNRRWDNTLNNLQPTAIRENLKRIEYFDLSEESSFISPREYRFFDIRTFRVRGRFVDKISSTGQGIDAYLYPDKSRKGLSYRSPLQEDYNGNYFLQNQEIGLGELEAQYINIHFFVEADQPIQKAPHVVGAFNLWSTKKDSKMKYDTELKGYTYNTLLKQGYYNYAYYVPEHPDKYPFDGGSFEADNEYEILVYYKEPIDLGHELIGYTRYRINGI